MAVRARSVVMTVPSGQTRAPGRNRLVLLVALIVLATVASIVAATSRGGASTAFVSARAPTPCTVEVRGLNAAAQALRRAHAGGVVCLAAGDYSGTLTLSGGHPRQVTLRAAPGRTVRTGSITIAAGGVTLKNLWIRGEIALGAGVSHVVIDHDDITGGGEGVVFDTSNCKIPNSPTWPGCEPQAQVSNVTISGNHFHDIGQGETEDAIHLDNWSNVTVTGNEFDRIIETGNHTDCLESIYGGTNLTFTRNYEHDNNCQGFFIKDGDASNVTVSDNLFVRDSEGSYANFSQVWNTQNLVVQHNTIWDDKGFALVADNASFSPTASIDHNLFSHFAVEPPSGTPYSLVESHNIFSAAPSGLRPTGTDRVSARARFRNPARGDYRLIKNPGGIGIDWSPAAQHYGPVG